MADPRSLDALDPPPWDAAPPDATYLVRRCHDLRRRPIDAFDIEDLRLMVGQAVGLQHLVPIALNRLEGNPLAEGDFFPGDLLLSVLRIEPSFWSAHAPLASKLNRVLDSIPADARLDAGLSAQIATFRARSA